MCVPTQVFIQGEIRNDNTGKTCEARILVDQGKLTNQGAVISEEFFRWIGLTYQSMRWGKVGTVAEGSRMERLGITNPFSIKLKGIYKRFLMQALVI